MSKNLIPAQRRERIQEFMAVRRVVASSELCALLDVSEATVRRDLEWLESEGFLERTHGGAILSHRLQQEPRYASRAHLYAEEKRIIGQAAAALIEDGDIIFINSGTTTTQVIHHIRNSAGVTVVTNNLSAAQELGEPGFELILLGGLFQPRSISVAGRFAVENLNQIYADKAFIGVDGLSLKHGCTVPMLAEAEVVRVMVERTHGPIAVVADNSKWGVVSNFEIAKIDQIDQLVTDTGLDDWAHTALSSRSVDIIVAGMGQPLPD